MSDQSSETQSRSIHPIAVRTTLAFLALGALWVLISHTLLPLLLASWTNSALFSVGEDLLAISLIGVSLYVMLRRGHRSADQAVEALTHEMQAHQMTEAALLQSQETERTARLLAEVLRDTSETLTETLDFDEVLDRILANIGRVLPHDAVTIMLIDETGRFAHIARHRGYTELQVVNWMQSLVFSVEDTYNLQVMVETGQALIISDTYAQAGWLDFPESHWIQSYVGAPIRSKGRVIGFLNVVSATRNFFMDEHARILQAFADQAATAIENARLFQEAQRRWREQSALLMASNAMSSSLDLPIVLNQMAEQMALALNATSAYICYWNRTDNSTRVVAEYYSPAASDAERAPYAGDDYEDDLEFLNQCVPMVRHVDDAQTPRATREHMLQYGAQSLLATPLIAKGSIYGYVSIWESRRRRKFTAEEIQLCQALAQQAAIAFDNARLFDAERRQLALARTLQAVGALLTAELNLKDVFKRVFDLLAEVVRYDAVAVELFDEHDQLYLAAQRGYPDPERARQATRTETGPTVRQRWGQSGIIIVTDTASDPRWLPISDFVFARARVGVWLRVHNRVLGLLNVDSRTPHAYDAAAGDTVMAFANQAAIAIENAQLLTAIRGQAAQLSMRVAERTTELEQERKRLQAILDAAGEGIVFTDTRGIINYVNPAMEKLTGYSTVEVLGQSARIWQSAHTLDSLYDQIWHMIGHGGIWSGELVNRRKDGHLYDAALTIAPLRDTHDRIIGYVGIQRDVTHYKEVERLKDQFVSNVSHELRTPLANVKLYLSLLERGRPEKRDQYLQTLQRETARLENLIEDLLDISRLDLGAVSIRVTATQVDSLLAQLIIDRSSLAAQRLLTLDYLPCADLPLALIDGDLFTQVISNLLGNAINYTPAGGTITIKSDIAPLEGGSGQWVTVTIQDTGPGISAADQPHIFERFYRGAAGRASGAPGTGLGLAICSEIIKRFNGRLTLDSKPDQGAIFTVWLKAAR